MCLMPTQNQVLSLAAVVQCCQQVHSLATTGQGNEDTINRLLEAILDLETHDPELMLGGVQGVRSGLDFIRSFNAAASDRNRLEITRLAGNVLQVQKSLHKNPDVIKRLGDEITELKQFCMLTPLDDDAIGRINNIYQQCLSPLRPSIVVNGSRDYLQQTNVVHKVRGLLLAGVRFAYLWKQLDGAFWHLLIMRKRYREIASGLLLQGV